MIAATCIRINNIMLCIEQKPYVNGKETDERAWTGHGIYPYTTTARLYFDIQQAFILNCNGKKKNKNTTERSNEKGK